MGQGVGETPRQVPAAPVKYINREVELSQAADLLQTAAARITVFSGLPGWARVRQSVDWLSRSARPFLVVICTSTTRTCVVRPTTRLLRTR
ncbi:hypothetical protein [Kibdelosporangium philippinense]|uniref:hypothetical protein n=1 Tax=Kibdelosporangium philippinense TaxID=211113 RepID=UPI00360803B3